MRGRGGNRIVRNGMLDRRAEHAIGQITEQVRKLFGDDLVCLVLYGSAASDEFVPGRSDLNMAIVLERLTFKHLKALHTFLPKWHKLGAATPLLLDRQFLDQARDVFPMEFHDIKTRHRVLYGEEVFATLAIEPRHLRYQAEHEARSKLLRLRALYAEVGAKRKRLETLMLDSAKTFVIIMRNLIRLQAAENHIGTLQIIDQFEARFGVELPTVRHLARVRQRMERRRSDAEETFAAYLREIEKLVDVVDRIPVTAQPVVHERIA